VVGVLAICHLVSLVIGEYFWQWERTFHMGRESNVPTWFSSMLLLGAGGLAFQCLRYSQERDRSVWAVLSIGFLFLSCDEVPMFHETIARVLEDNLYVFGFDFSTFASNWPILLSPIIVIATLWFLIQVPKALKGSTSASKLIVAGFSVFVAAVVGIELSENLLLGEGLGWLRKTAVLLEESLEMIGVILMGYGFLVHSQFLQLNRKEPNVADHFLIGRSKV